MRSIAKRKRETVSASIEEKKSRNELFNWQNTSSVSIGVSSSAPSSSGEVNNILEPPSSGIDQISGRYWASN